MRKNKRETIEIQCNAREVMHDLNAKLSNQSLSNKIFNIISYICLTYEKRISKSQEFMSFHIFYSYNRSSK